MPKNNNELLYKLIMNTCQYKIETYNALRVAQRRGRGLDMFVWELHPDIIEFLNEYCQHRGAQFKSTIFGIEVTSNAETYISLNFNKKGLTL